MCACLASGRHPVDGPLRAPTVALRREQGDEPAALETIEHGVEARASRDGDDPGFAAVDERAMQTVGVLGPLGQGRQNDESQGGPSIGGRRHAAIVVAKLD